MKRMTFKACQVLLALCVLIRTVPAQEPQPGTPDFTAPAADAAAPSDMPATLSPEGAAPQTDTPDSTPVPAIPLDLPPPTQAADSAPAAPQLIPGNAVSVTVAQMGQPQGVILSGGQLQAGINFTLPSDQVITSAQLNLNLKVSPDMAARNATLQLMMNGQPLGTVPLGTSDSNVSNYQLEIPAALVVSSNNISFKINDGDALLCLRDLSDKYQVTIMPDTRLDLEG